MEKLFYIDRETSVILRVEDPEIIYQIDVSSDRISRRGIVTVSRIVEISIISENTTQKKELELRHVEVIDISDNIKEKISKIMDFSKELREIDNAIEGHRKIITELSQYGKVHLNIS